MPISAEPLTWLGYTWQPQFSRIAQRSLEEAGFDQTQLNMEALMKGAGPGLDEKMQVLLVWAGQRWRDKHITPERVRNWKDRLGEKGWTILVNWYAAVFSSWLLARATARLGTGLTTVAVKERL